MNAIIESGIIKKQINSSSKIIPYEMKFLDERYLNQIMSLEETIINNLSNSELYEFVPAEFMRNQFRKEGRIIGIISEGQLVAFRVLHFPAMATDATVTAENLGFDLNIPENELHKVAHLEVSLVHPEYRGNSLALKMNRYAMNIAKKLNYSHLCVTVSPKNYANVVTMFKAGLVVKALKDKYGGKLRYIFYQHLKNPIINKSDEEIVINISNIHKQQEILERGLVGYRVLRNSEELEIVYAKCNHSKVI